MSEFLKSTIGAAGTKAISFVVFLVLARLLTPEAFGLMALLMILFSFGAIFVEVGLGAALLHLQKATPGHYSAAFAMTLSIATGLLFLIWAIADYYASFFDEARLETLIRYFSLYLILSALSVVPYSVLQKRRDFGAIAYADIVSVLLASTIAIILALQGSGVYALIAHKLFSTLFRALILFRKSGWKPETGFGGKEFGDLWRYIRYLLASKVMNYGVDNVDEILVGKVASTEALGAYNFAFQILMMPRSIVASVFNPVLTSRYASIQTKANDIANFHLKTCLLVAFLSMPVNGLLFVSSEWLVEVALNPSWNELTGFIRYFAVIALFYPLTILNASVFLSTGNTKLQLKMGLWVKGTTIISVLIGAISGVDGILNALLIVSIFGFVLSFQFVSRIIPIPLHIFLVQILRTLAPTTMSVGICSYLVEWAEFSISLQGLVFVFLSYLLFYAVFVLLIDLGGVRRAKDFFSNGMVIK